jgi:hypothetical protein
MRRGNPSAPPWTVNYTQMPVTLIAEGLHIKPNRYQATCSDLLGSAARADVAFVHWRQKQRDDIMSPRAERDRYEVGNVGVSAGSEHDVVENRDISGEVRINSTSPESRV